MFYIILVMFAHTSPSAPFYPYNTLADRINGAKWFHAVIASVLNFGGSNVDDGGVSGFQLK